MSWAEDSSTPQVTVNPDGTKTVVTFRINSDGKQVKVTQKIKEVHVRESVHPAVATRRTWAKYGDEEGSAPGPDFRTTQIGEAVQLNLGTGWRDIEAQEEAAKAENTAKAATLQRIKCRTCGGDHFTAKCPFKDTLGVDAAEGTPEPDVLSKAGGAYVPPLLRGRPAGARFEDRDDSTTLRITQLNEVVDEEMLREELLAPFGPLMRVLVVRNRETGRSKGVAYVSFATVERAQAAIDALDGRGYHLLIVHLEFAKRN